VLSRILERSIDMKALPISKPASLLFTLLLAGLMASCASKHQPEVGGRVGDTAEQARHDRIAKAYGFFPEFERGRALVRTLSALHSDNSRKFDPTDFVDHLVAFVGVGAEPGATNDLFIQGGYYLRVANPKNLDLRPHDIGWEVIIRGKILMVLPQNKLIIIEVDESSWKVIQTS